MTPKIEKPVSIYVSPSAWQTWTKCALSLQHTKTTLSTAGDDFATSGTNLHLLIAHLINNKNLDFTTLDIDDAALVRFAVETTRAEAVGMPIKTEFFMESKKAGLTIGGTADAVIVNGDTVTIVDHKTGWKEVDADGNKQLKIYAHLYAAKNKKIKKWRGVIINARFNSTSYTGGDIETSYLLGEAKDINARTAAGQRATGNHCAYCQRMSICKMLRNEVLKWMAPGAIDSLTRDPEKLAEALKLAKPAEKLFDTIKKEAQLFIDLGGTIPGVTMEYSPGTRSWPKDLSYVSICQSINLDPKEMIDEKIISPAEAERRGASKDAVNAICVRPPRKGFKFS